MNQLRNIIKYAVIPRRCEVCGAVVSIDESVCQSCRENNIISGDICLKCGRVKEKCNCDKSHHKNEYSSVVAPFEYGDNVVRAVHRLKFYGRSELAYSMANQISKTVIDRYDNIHFDYVTCVPMTKRRTIRRGYNQSELLAKGVAMNIGVPFKPLVRKIFDNPPQRTLSARYRRGNVFGVYDIRDDADIDGKTILLIDDVKTTGATLNACSYVLKIYGASAVYAAAFAIR